MPLSCSDCRQSASKQEHWCCLSSPALNRIFYFLSRRDQFNMSLVCHRWSEEFHLSSATETFRFALSETQLLSEKYKERLERFVEKHGIMFKHVEIECIYEDYSLMKTWGRLFIRFLKILERNYQLISFKFNSVIGLWFSYLHSDEICGSISKFMESQYYLKMVVFKDCYFKFSVGLEILRKLMEHNKNSLSHVVLQGFIRNSYEDAVENLSTFVDLPRLTTLEMDYSLIFENIFTAARNGQKSQLSKIILHCEEILSQNFRGLSSTDWKNLKLLCPYMNLELNITKWFWNRQMEEFFIVRCMPVTRLIFTTNPIHKSELRVDAFFRHLLACEINNQLDYLGLYLNAPIQHFSSTFIPFIQACKKLECFVLSVVYETIGIDLLLESFLDNRHESLEKVNITISNLENEENYTALSNLINSYSTRLRTAGLKLRVFYYDWNKYNVIHEF